MEVLMKFLKNPALGLAFLLAGAQCSGMNTPSHITILNKEVITDADYDRKIDQAFKSWELYDKENPPFFRKQSPQRNVTLPHNDRQLSPMENQRIDNAMKAQELYDQELENENHFGHYNKRSHPQPRAPQSDPQQLTQNKTSSDESMPTSTPINNPTVNRRLAVLAGHLQTMNSK
jgi:hypothetical protein